jgi:2'-5' RNA ligase
MQSDIGENRNTESPVLHRLFFAWWPPVEAQEQLHQIAQEQVPGHNARLTRRDKIHLTLAFLGPVDEAFAQCARRAAADVRWQPFSLVFDRLGWFPRARVMWAGCSASGTQLADLVDQLNQNLVQCGYQPEQRRYQPHLTLARKVNRGPRAIEIPPLECRFERFALVESVLDAEGAHYHVLDQFEPEEN